MRSSITKRLALIASIPATLLGLVMVATPAQAAAVTSAVTPAKLQGDIVYLSNKQRALHGCKPLHADARLTAASVAHSAYMAQSGSFSHIGRGNSSFVYRDKAAHYPRPLAENIAYGYRTGVDVVVAWMNSPEHRANLLNCKATTVGVGAVYAANGTPYYTQDFGY
jgi:uncharacterized protein YkwD